MLIYPNLEHLDFADDLLNVTQVMKFVFERVENIIGKGENSGNQQHIYVIIRNY